MVGVADFSFFERRGGRAMHWSGFLLQLLIFFFMRGLFSLFWYNQSYSYSSHHHFFVYKSALYTVFLMN